MTQGGSESDFQWLQNSKGDRPTLRWAVSTDSQLMSFDLSRETGGTIAADSMGGLSHFDRRGNLVSINRGFDGVQDVRWSDNGNGGAILVGEDAIVKVRQSLALRWSVDLPSPVTAFDVDPYGNHIAVCMANGKNRIYDWKKSRVTEFETIQPLSFIRFVANEQRLVCSAEYGLLSCHNFDGDELWNEKLWTNVGDISIAGDGETILLAGFNHGVQVFDDDGTHRGSYMMEGSPGLVSTSFIPERVAAATIEKHLYWLDSDGEMIWACSPDSEVIGLQTDALGNGMLCGLASGHILRLTWDDAADDDDDESL
ncbi:WD40 repeat domain-containing protein [bacterium]|nr:WD40 repeat domain-containing protein [bacterium]